MKSRYLSKAEILAADDFVTEAVAVPGWGKGEKTEVLVRSMSGVNRDRFETLLILKNFENIRAKVCAWTVCDEQGNLLFSESDIIDLGKKSGACLQRVWEAALRLNSITPDDVDSLKKS